MTNYPKVLTLGYIKIHLVCPDVTKHQVEASSHMSIPNLCFASS